jgi:hypothetical protein
MPDYEMCERVPTLRASSPLNLSVMGTSQAAESDEPEDDGPISALVCRLRKLQARRWHVYSRVDTKDYSSRYPFVMMRKL